MNFIPKNSKPYRQTGGGFGILGRTTRDNLPSTTSPTSIRHLGPDSIPLGRQGGFTATDDANRGQSDSRDDSEVDRRRRGIGRFDRTISGARGSDCRTGGSEECLDSVFQRERAYEKFIRDLHSEFKWKSGNSNNGQEPVVQFTKPDKFHVKWTSDRRRPITLTNQGASTTKSTSTPSSTLANNYLPSE